MGKTRFQNQLRKASRGQLDTEKKSRNTYCDKEKRRQVEHFLEAKEKDTKLTKQCFAAGINVPLQTFHKWTKRYEALPSR